MFEQAHQAERAITRGGGRPRQMRTGLFDLIEPLLGGGQHPDLFAHLDGDSRRMVHSRAKRLQHSKDINLFRQGEKHTGIFFIVSGHVRTFYTSQSGRQITLAHWLPSAVVGTPDVFGSSPHMWSGVAIEETETLLFTGSCLRELMAQSPGLAIGVAEVLAFKGRCLSALVQLLGTRSVGERLTQTLVALCGRYGVRERDGILVKAHITHQDLACMVGASRQWVTITLDRMQKDGIIAIGNRSIKVLRPEVLGANTAKGETGAENNCGI